MQLGKINKLTIKRFAPPGAYLIDLQENEVLLPNKYLTPDMEEGTEVEVFVMKDSSERLVCVTERPYILLGDCVYLDVVEVNPFGAFVDWGLDKDLFVPDDDYLENRYGWNKGKTHEEKLEESLNIWGSIAYKGIIEPKYIIDKDFDYYS